MAWCVVGCVASPAAAATAPPPNVVLILCDDLGYGDLGCYGRTDIRTPALDRMAREGLRFTDFAVASALCTPSRAALLTGCYPGRVGLATGVLRPEVTTGLHPDEVTLAEMFRGAGYATGLIGKWHLGFRGAMRPLGQGFDHYYGVLHNLDPPETAIFEPLGGTPVVRGDTVDHRPAEPAQITQLYTAEALRFVDEHAARPFFLMISHQMPHLPFDASPAFRGQSPAGLYGDVVEELDWSVGQLLDRLRAGPLAARTLVLFTSDNGPERRTPGSAGPLRGSKHTVYEGGLRVPLIAWWPGTVPAGRTCDEFATAMDLWPTLARLVGQSPPPDRRLDGLDIGPLLRGEPGARSPHGPVYFRYGYRERSLEAVRDGRWKLHLADPPELYDLTADVGETRNLAAAEPATVERLRRVADELRRRIAAEARPLGQVNEPAGAPPP